MARLYDLARMTTATTGTGTITLGTAVAGFLSFSGAGISDGDVIDYAINDPGINPTASEIGTGTYTVSGTTLSRTPTKSTNGNAAINLSGNAQVFICPRAETLNDASLFTTGALALAQGGLGGSQAAATAGQVPVYPGSGGAAVPTSFLQTGTGAMARTWNAKVADILSVKDFGAAGNGSTDDTAAIQAAVTAAAASGGTVYFPAGSYKTTAVVTLAANVDLRGAGRDSVYILPKTNSQTVFLLTYGTITAAYVSISDLSIHAGAVTGVTGISITLARNVLLYNLTFFGTGAGSIVLDRGDTYTISNVISQGNAGQGAGGLKIWSSSDSDYIYGVQVTNYRGFNLGNGFQQPFIYLRRAIGVQATALYANDLSSGGTPQNGIVVENDSQGNQFNNVLLVKPAIGVLVQQGSGVAASPTFNTFNVLSVDQPQTNAISQTSGSWNDYLGGKLTASGSVTTIPAISIAGTSWNTIAYLNIVGFSGTGGSAISLTSGVAGLQIHDNVFQNNTTIFNFSSTATNVSISNNIWDTFTNQTLGTITGARFVNNNGSTIDYLVSPTYVGATAASGFYLGTAQALYQAGNYTVIGTPNGTQIISGGNASDPTNYYDNDTHNFRNAAGSSYGTWGTSGLTMALVAETLVLKRGANGCCGTFVANGATPVTVSNTNIAITDCIIISLNTAGGTVGTDPAVRTITAGVGFTVAGIALDTSTYNYAIIKNAA